MLKPGCAALLLLALASLSPDADARGKGRSSSSASSRSNADANRGTTVILRNGSSSSSGSSQSSLGNDLVPIEPGAGPGSANLEPARTPEEQAAIDRARAALAVKERAALEKAEADRIAAEQLAEKQAAERAATRAAAERAEAARLAAALEQKRREEAAVAADVDRVLKRAMADYPLLAMPEGGAVLQQILARQKVLAAQGMYPSIAMVEAVADHAHVLAPRHKQQKTVEAAPAAQARTVGGCRWVSAAEWSCN
ncbi:MAG TPA: hypothetical protein VLJ58_20795 [Ramlibacter sp.]|nr:hypothetical protein [Ramlibacter sp.]